MAKRPSASRFIQRHFEEVSTNSRPAVSETAQKGLLSMRSVRVPCCRSTGWFTRALASNSSLICNRKLKGPYSLPLILLLLMLSAPMVYAQPFSKEARISASDAMATDSFGSSVSVSGDNLGASTLLLGAPGVDVGGSDAGAAYVFDRSTAGLNQWEEVAKLVADDAASQDNFGLSVSLSGDLAVVGSPFDDDDGMTSGAAYIFRRDEGVLTTGVKLSSLPPMMQAEAMDLGLP